MTDPAAPRPWRCFVAVALPDDLRSSLQEWVDGARRDPALDAEWRWSDPAGWHVTLAFLGATSPDAVTGIHHRLSVAVEGWAGFTVSAGGIGGFPGRSRARVLWYGIRDDDERHLAQLARAVRLATGADDGAPFRPHVTLARARERRGTPLPALSTDSLPSGEVPVTRVALMRSHLGHGPAQYEPLAEVALAIPSATGAPA